MARYKLRLFVTGNAGLSMSAITNAQAIGNQALHGDYELEVVDVLQNPEQAEREKIVVTPTLILDAPLPSRRLIGDLSHTPRVLSGLGIVPEIGQGKS